jgi:hypothetical protein
MTAFNALKSISRTEVSETIPQSGSNPLIGFLVADTLGWQLAAPEGTPVSLRLACRGRDPDPLVKTGWNWIQPPVAAEIQKVIRFY